MEYTVSDNSLGGDRNWQRGEAAIAAVLPVGKNLIWTTLAGGTDFNSGLPFDRMYTLGGPSSFPGFELGEMRTTDYATLSAYLHKLGDIVSLRGQAVYLGLRLQGAQLTDANPLDAETKDLTIYGGSLYLTGSTPVRPPTILERAMRIEPTAQAWEAWVLPLYDARNRLDSKQETHAQTMRELLGPGRRLERAVKSGSDSNILTMKSSMLRQPLNIT